jgi:hypothetical protein
MILRQNGSDWKFSKASSKDNSSLFVFLCKSKFNLNLGFTIVCLSNEMIYKYSFQIFIYWWDSSIFASHNKSLMYKLLIRRILFWFDPEKCILLFLDSVLSKIPGFSSIFKLLYGINDKRLETEVFGLKFKKSSRTCSWIW